MAVRRSFDNRVAAPHHVNIVYEGLPKDDPQSSQLHQREHHHSFLLTFTCRAELMMPCSSRPENNTHPYTIGTTSLNRTLDDNSLTGLLNSVIVQQWAWGGRMSTLDALY